MLHSLIPYSLCCLGTLSAESVLSPETTPAGEHALRQDWIPVDAEVVVSVDLEAVSRAAVGKSLASYSSGLEIDSIDRFVSWQDRLEMDLGRDVKAITIYVTPPEDAAPVLILSMSPSAKSLFEDMPEDSGYWRRTVDEREIHSFQSEDKRFYAYVCEVQDSIRPVVFCPDLGQVFGAVAVIEGKLPSLRGSKNPIALRKARPGTFAFLVATSVSKFQATPSSILFMESSSFAIEAGEHEGQFFAEITFVTKSEGSASTVADVATGLLSLSKLIARHEDTTDEVKEGRLALLNAVHVQGRGREILVLFQRPAKQLVDILSKEK